MSPIVVTTGTRFVDIDALACVVAYEEVPIEGATGVIVGKLNHSVTSQIRKWTLNYQTKFENTPETKYVITDVSEESQFPPFVKREQIIEIYDHHFGFEKNWIEKIGVQNVKIEAVGACATLIWEELKKRKAPLITNSQLLITPLAANLLYTAILSNTLNFLSSLTTERDRKAYEELKALIDLPQDWTAQYFLDIEMEAYKNPSRVIQNDTKIQIVRGIECAIGQLELWNSRDFLRENQDRIEATLREYGTQLWFLTAPAISEGRNYIFTKNKIIKEALRSVLDITFDGDIGATTKLWLRKEILKKIQ